MVPKSEISRAKQVGELFVNALGCPRLERLLYVADQPRKMLALHEVFVAEIFVPQLARRVAEQLHQVVAIDRTLLVLSAQENIHRCDFLGVCEVDLVGSADDSVLQTLPVGTVGF